MFVADGETRDPPIGHVRMIAVSNMYRSPATDNAFVLVIKPLETMQIMKIPSQRAMFTIDLQGVERLMAARVAGGFEQWRVIRF